MQGLNTGTSDRKCVSAPAGRARGAFAPLLSAWVVLVPTAAHAEIDGHGPDAWRVTGVASNDVLNARMGPGTEYPIIETFAHNERGLEQITCVPYYTMTHFQAMSVGELDALPPRWCLMRSEDMAKAGWVSQRYIIDETASPSTDLSATPESTDSDQMIYLTQEVLWALYENADMATMGGPNPLDPAFAHNYFSSDIVDYLRTNTLQVDPLYGTQNFQGSITEPVPDSDQPILRGMITLHSEITNFGETRTVTYRLRADPSQPESPIRIFRIEHEGWSFPDY